MNAFDVIITETDNNNIKCIHIYILLIGSD